MDGSPFSGANEKIEKIQLFSLCVLDQSVSRAIEQLSYILETREERTFDNIFDVKIFSFQFDQYPLAEQFTGMNTFTRPFECSFVCTMICKAIVLVHLFQCNYLSLNAGVHFLQCYRCMSELNIFSCC